MNYLETFIVKKKRQKELTKEIENMLKEISSNYDYLQELVFVHRKTLGFNQKDFYKLFLEHKKLKKNDLEKFILEIGEDYSYKDNMQEYAEKIYLKEFQDEFSEEVLLHIILRGRTSSFRGLTSLYNQPEAFRHYLKKSKSANGFYQIVLSLNYTKITEPAFNKFCELKQPTKDELLKICDAETSQDIRFKARMYINLMS